MRTTLASLCLLAAVIVGSAQQTPNISEIDRIRLAEAYRLSEELGNRIWTNWSKAPFAVLFVTSDYEFLVRHPRPTNDFTLIGYDNLLKSNVYFRKRTQRVNVLATFPAVGGISTIVVGQAENTQAKTSTPWVVTLLHEHFHQLQDSEPNAFAEVAALNLARGDQTGMWMLNFPFPYETPEMKQQFSLLADDVMNGIMKELSTLKIEEYKRVAFYPIGAGEALLLDRVNPGWQRKYLVEKFDLEKYFP